MLTSIIIVSIISTVYGIGKTYFYDKEFTYKHL